MTTQEFKRWSQKQGCTLEPGRGGHLVVRRGDRVTDLPMYGKHKELGTGLVKAIKKHLGLNNPGGPFMNYPATITRDDNNTWLVTFPDIEGVTFGKTIEEALAHAADALGSMLEADIKDRRPIPLPSTTHRTKYRVTVPARGAACRPGATYVECVL